MRFVRFLLCSDAAARRRTHHPITLLGDSKGRIDEHTEGNCRLITTVIAGIDTEISAAKGWWTLAAPRFEALVS